MGFLRGAIIGDEKKEKKKKPDDLLSSVVRETAIPAAIELLRENEPFAFPNGTAWAVLLLKADAIGGLSRKHSRDEAKGSIIELIADDQIHTIATAEMLKEDVFGIIPTSETLDRMDEYSLLTNADYAWGVLWQGENFDLVIDLTGKATFAEAQQVSRGELSLEQAVGTKAWTENGGETSPQHPRPDGDDTGDTGAEPEFGGYDEFDDEQPNFADDDLDPGEDETGLPEFADTADTAELADLAGDEAPGGPEENDDGDPDDSGSEVSDDGVEEPLAADEAQVRQQIARRFLGEELNLEVTLAEFNTIIDVAKPPVRIETPDNVTGWLGDQIAQMSRQANAELEQAHDAHIRSLRALYVDLMSRHVDEVISFVSLKGPRYKELLAKVESDRSEREAASDQLIRDRHRQIRTDFEHQAKAEATRAAAEAEARYTARNEARMQRDLLDAGAEIERRNEEIYARDRQQILDIRRQHAQTRLEAGQSHVLQLIADKRAEQEAAEQELLQRWNTDIMRIVDDNRKHDIDRIRALTEQQNRENEVEQLKAEQAATLSRLQSEHEERLQRMHDDLARSRSEAAAQMESNDAEWKHLLDLEKEKTLGEATRARDVEQSYQNRLEELEADKRSYADELERASVIQSRSNKILIVLIIFIGIALGAAGFILGAAAMS